AGGRGNGKRVLIFRSRGRPDSRQDPLASGIIKGLQMNPGRTAAAADIDLISARVDELRRDFGGVVYITHRDRAADGVAVGAGSRVADRFAVAMDKFTAPEDGFGIFQHEDRQTPPDA